jgi:hypothetical protein
MGMTLALCNFIAPHATPCTRQISRKSPPNIAPLYSKGLRECFSDSGEFSMKSEKFDALALHLASGFCAYKNVKPAGEGAGAPRVGAPRGVRCAHLFFIH